MNFKQKLAKLQDIVSVLREVDCTAKTPLHETDYNWRIEPGISGPSRCISDIGTHWMDTIQHVLGAKITEVCAPL